MQIIIFAFALAAISALVTAARNYRALALILAAGPALWSLFVFVGQVTHGVPPTVDVMLLVGGIYVAIGLVGAVIGFVIELVARQRLSGETWPQFAARAFATLRSWPAPPG